MQFQLDRHQKASWIQGLLCSITLGLGWGTAMPSTLAAETVTIRLGPFQQTIAITDLEKFANTGKLPEKLEVFSPVLTSDVRELLTKRLEVDPGLTDKFLKKLMQAPGGKQFISSLEAAIPGSTVESLSFALNLALRQVNGLNALSFLRAYPGENVTVDASKAIGLAVEFNPNYLQSKAFGVLLERELSSTKTDTSFHSEFNPATVGKEMVQEQTLVLRDVQRNRFIPIDIYWSKANSENPLVVLSHGFGANRQFLGYLGRHLASHGITVAAIEHPGSNSAAVSQASNGASLAQLLKATEFIERPKDVSFLLDELAKLNTQPGQFQGKLNTQKVTVIGHSLGGYTALALIGGEVNLQQLRRFCQQTLSIAKAPGDWLQCAAVSLPQKKLQLQDERVKSAIALNPLVGELFGNKGLTRVTRPVLILTGTEDSLTPALRHQIQPFTQLQGNKYLLTAIGGTHLTISDPRHVASAASSVVKERRGKQTESLHYLTKGVSLAFIKQLTPKAKIYQQFLTPEYAQFFSTPQLPLHLVSELPANIKSWVESN
jgi:predicted dienelactone hydrolase